MSRIITPIQGASEFSCGTERDSSRNQFELISCFRANPEISRIKEPFQSKIQILGDNLYGTVDIFFPISELAPINKEVIGRCVNEHLSVL